ncbi:MAG: thioredoxin domain-containing protein [Lentisphaeria bacterium]|nr:thioredoxin domain-containing protein [Lentisphaeria bacterium]
MSEIKELTAANFNESTSTGTWLVDFWATWCGPCRMQGRIIDENLEALNNAGLQVGKVNVDDQTGLAMRFKVLSIPTLLIIKNGQLVKQFVGVQQLGTLLEAAK